MERMVIESHRIASPRLCSRSPAHRPFDSFPTSQQTSAPLIHSLAHFAMSAANSDCATDAVADTAAAALSPSPTAYQHSFWLSSLSAHGSSLLQTMLLHDDEAEAEEMNREEMEEIMNMCNIRKEWTVYGQ